MCTVLYVPGDDAVILASNRDESRQRQPGTLPLIEELHGHRVLRPVDTAVGGSWIAADELGRIFCLLNGAFVRHQHRPPYRRSRGLVVLDSMACNDLIEFAEGTDFEGIEPFTLIQVSTRSNPAVHELRWDGAVPHLQQLDPAKPHLWSSAPLYSEEAQTQAVEAFRGALAEATVFDRQAAMEFLDAHTYPIRCRRQGVEPYPTVDTVSSCAFEIGQGMVRCSFRDRLRQGESETVMRI